MVKLFILVHLTSDCFSSDRFWGNRSFSINVAKKEKKMKLENLEIMKES